MVRKVPDNSPKKGSRIQVDPIKDKQAIEKIKKNLAHRHRNLLLFVLGINNGLRISDLLNLKVKDVKGLKAGEYISIKESKTGKDNVLMVNKATHKVLKAYFESTDLKEDDPLFISSKTKKALTKSAANHMVKRWCKEVGLIGNFGTHSLRKTFGFIQRTHFGVGFELLCKRFGHSSPAITMRYLGISDKEVNGILLNEI